MTLIKNSLKLFLNSLYLFGKVTFFSVKHSIYKFINFVYYKLFTLSAFKLTLCLFILVYGAIFFSSIYAVYHEYYNIVHSIHDISMYNTIRESSVILKKAMYPGPIGPVVHGQWTQLIVNQMNMSELAENPHMAHPRLMGIANNNSEIIRHRIAERMVHSKIETELDNICDLNTNLFDTVIKYSIPLIAAVLGLTLLITTETLTNILV